MLTCVDAFCGAGGLTLGLRQAGLEVVHAFDNDEKAVETYRNNIGDHVQLQSAYDVTGQDILDVTGLNQIDVFAGGPPCQGFSKQKRGAHRGDARNHLVLEFARLVSDLRPKIFLLENVAMFGHKRGRRFVADIRELLTDYRLGPVHTSAPRY